MDHWEWPCRTATEETIEPYLTTTTNRVNDLSTDLADGRVLGELLEKISKDKVRYMREDRQLKFKPQKLENLGISFKFLEKEQIKLVNIGELVSR